MLDFHGVTASEIFHVACTEQKEKEQREAKLELLINNLENSILDLNKEKNEQDR